MSSKPTVTLTLAGDEKKLTDAFDKVGSASKSMGEKVASTSSDFDKVGRSTEDFVDKADGAEQKAIGFTDTLSGMQGAFQGLTDDSLSFGERLAVLGQAAADLAGGFANLIIPALSSMWAKLTATTAAQWLLTAAQTTGTAIMGGLSAAWGVLNAVMAANPIITIIVIIGLLVAAFIWLWNNCEGFRDFWKGIWEDITRQVGGAVDWIKGVWNGMISFFSGLVTAIGNIFSGIGGAIKGAFKSAINWVIDMLNHVIDFFNKIVYGINLVNPFDDIPDIPHIPRMHTGGVVPGLPGQEVLMTLQGGERVSTSGQGGGGTVTFAGDLDSALARLFMKMIRTGDIRIEGA